MFKAFNPNDKTNLAPYRVIHFVIIAFFVTRFVPRNWKGLEWEGFRPAILCGQHSLEVFCAGVFLAFVGHFLLILNPRAVRCSSWSASAASRCCARVAYVKDWSAKLDKKPPRMAEDGVTPARKMGPSILNRRRATRRQERGLKPRRRSAAAGVSSTLTICDGSILSQTG